MKTLQQWFDDYSESHRNQTNKAIHFLCVPAIYFSLVGLLMCIPNWMLARISPFHDPLLDNWAVVALCFALFFYSRLSLMMAIKMALFSGVCIIFNFLISFQLPLWRISLFIFTTAWAAQFVGHILEGKKPSFIRDLQFLLIGPAWVIENLFSTSNRE